MGVSRSQGRITLVEEGLGMRKILQSWAHCGRNWRNALGVLTVILGSCDMINTTIFTTGYYYQHNSAEVIYSPIDTLAHYTNGQHAVACTTSNKYGRNTTATLEISHRIFTSFNFGDTEKCCSHCQNMASVSAFTWLLSIDKAALSCNNPASHPHQVCGVSCMNLYGWSKTLSPKSLRVST